MGNQYMIRIHKDQSCNNISTANRARALSLSSELVARALLGFSSSKNIDHFQTDADAERGNRRRSHGYLRNAPRRGLFKYDFYRDLTL